MLGRLAPARPRARGRGRTRSLPPGPKTGTALSSETPQETPNRPSGPPSYLPATKDTSATRATLCAPDATFSDGKGFRPTEAMEKVSNVLIDGPDDGPSSRASRDAVATKEDTVRLAVAPPNATSLPNLARATRNCTRCCARTGGRRTQRTNEPMRVANCLPSVARR